MSYPMSLFFGNLVNMTLHCQSNGPNHAFSSENNLPRFLSMQLTVLIIEDVPLHTKCSESLFQIFDSLFQIFHLSFQHF